MVLLGVASRVNWLEEGRADRFAFKLVVLRVCESKVICRHHPSILVACNLVLLILHGAHNTSRQVDNIAENRKLLA